MARVLNKYKEGIPAGAACAEYLGKRYGDNIDPAECAKFAIRGPLQVAVNRRKLYEGGFTSSDRTAILSSS